MGVTDSDLVLSVDLGTGGPKVGFVTVHGEVLWWEHTPVPTIVGDRRSAHAGRRALVDGDR